LECNKKEINWNATKRYQNKKLQEDDNKSLQNVYKHTGYDLNNK
jgi:hypothetical protein